MIRIRSVSIAVVAVLFLAWGMAGQARADDEGYIRFDKEIISGPTRIVPMNTDVHWTVRIVFQNRTDDVLKDVVVTDIFAADTEVGGGVATGYAGAVLPGYPVCLKLDGSGAGSGGTVALEPVGGSPTGATHLTWSIGAVNSYIGCELRLDVSTDINPAGHQEYTSSGLHCINSGATAKFYNYGIQESISTLPVCVMAQ